MSTRFRNQTASSEFRPEVLAYGHSFLAEQGVADETRYYARQVAAELGLAYPTAVGGRENELNRAVGGSSMRDAAVRALTEYHRDIPSGSALVIIQGLINSARLHGTVPADLTTARHALHALLAVVNADSRRDVTDTATFRFGDGWRSSTGHRDRPATRWRDTASLGAWVDIAAPDHDSYLVFAGTSTSGGPRVTVTDLTDPRCPAESFTLADQCVQSAIWVPVAYRVPPAMRGHDIRFSYAEGTAPLALSSLLIQSPTPPVVLLMKEPYLADYTASTAFPCGSDETLDAFNALMDEMAATFPNSTVADPNVAGFWDKTRHIQGDHVHPNESGHDALACTALAVLQSRGGG